MINCNPETVSTDYDTADRLYFEPLTFEDVLEVVHAEQQSGTGRRRHLHARRADPARAGPAAQGRRRARARHAARGDRPGRAPRRVRPGARRGRPAGAASTAPRSSFEEAKAVADAIGYPVLVRPSYVLGGRGMEIVYDEEHLSDYISRATEITPDHPVLVDRFLDDAIEIDVDALYDGTDLYLGGVMEHIEEAGIHSGDSACALPPITLGAPDIAAVRPLDARDRARASACAGCSTCSTRWPATCCTCSRRTRAPAAPCRSCRRRPRCRWPRRRPGSRSARRSPNCAPRGCCPHQRRRRRPAGRRADRGQGGGAAVPPVPHPRRRPGRLDPRPGDEVDRRGDGLRRDVRHRVRQEPGRRLRIAADEGHGVRQRSPTATSGPRSSR